MSEISALKEEVQQIRDFPALPPPTQASEGIGMNTSSTAVEIGLDSSRATIDRNRGSEFDKKVVDICEKARRIIGLTPIEPRMLDIQVKSYGAKNMEEAMLLEVKSYLKCEMKVKPTELEKLDIVRIFPPAKESWDTLYAEFRKEY